MSLRPDPGGVFASDQHRRLLGHLADDPLPIQGDSPKTGLGLRVSQDPNHGLDDVEQLESILGELAAEGYASEVKAGWKITKKGLDALQEPVRGTDETPGPAIIKGVELHGTGGVNA